MIAFSIQNWYRIGSMHVLKTILIFLFGFEKVWLFIKIGIGWVNACPETVFNAPS